MGAYCVRRRSRSRSPPSWHGSIRLACYCGSEVLQDRLPYIGLSTDIPFAATLRTHGRDQKLTSPPFGSSTRTAGVDPRNDSLSRAYRIIVRKTNAEEPSGFRLAVTHVLGLFCNASAKYAQGLRPWRATRGTPIFRAALVQTSCLRVGVYTIP